MSKRAKTALNAAALGVCEVPIGAGEAIRTPDPNLGKVMLYP